MEEAEDLFNLNEDLAILGDSINLDLPGTLLSDAQLPHLPSILSTPTTTTTSTIIYLSTIRVQIEWISPRPRSEIPKHTENQHIQN